MKDEFRIGKITVKINTEDTYFPLSIDDGYGAIALTWKEWDAIRDHIGDIVK